MKKLTKRQNQILEFIISFIKKNSIAPSIREIADYFNFTAKASFDHLIALEKKGEISRNGLSRGLIVHKIKIDSKISRDVVINFNKLSKTNSYMRNIPRAKECIICKKKKNIER
ncbi:unnamed protein product, partial [marine sediment metagenome]